MCFVLKETKSAQFKELEIVFCPCEQQDCAGDPDPPCSLSGKHGAIGDLMMDAEVDTS